ncbi:MAG TPA: hypothetical protein DD727_06565, partial [Clostridiales bacterium]|nr:hypothetical protein [Clostridiales bacterium]
MIVAVDPKLCRLAKELAVRGYHVVEAETYRGKVDALVYADSSLFLSRDVECAEETGMFMVNGKGLSADQVV